MELFVFRHAEWERLYNCSQVHIELIPVQERIFLPESVVIITLCAVYYMLYAPCVVSTWRRMASSSTSRGRTALAATEIFADFVLALNRAVDMISTELEERLFGDKKVYYWQVLISAMGICWLLFVTPAVYSSVNFGGFFFNPYAGYNVTTEQTEPLAHVALSYSLCFAMPVIYLVFGVALLFQLKWKRQSSIGLRTQMMIFLQVFLISVFNAIAGFLYMYCQHQSVVTQTMMTVALFSWFHIHGSPPLIYLALNKTIQQDCKEMIGKCFAKVTNRNSSTVVVKVFPWSATTPAV